MACRQASRHFRATVKVGLDSRTCLATNSSSLRYVSSAARAGPSLLTISPGILTPRSTLSFNVHLLQRRSMFIQTETTPNEDSLKFIPGVSVMGEGTAEFLDTRSALKSPLAIRLMGIEGVKGVFYGPDFVTVSKEAETTWSVMKPEVYSTLMEHFSSGMPLFRTQEDRDEVGPQDTRILDTDSETVAMVKELLETRVRPAIMEDGGDIEYRGFGEDGYVKVKLKGSCRGCSSSTVTLKSGIERMLMHYIPEVKGVEQVLDEEEIIAQSELEKLEQRLAREKEAPRDKHEMAKYMSV
ncbi:HIRA-interacting protein 5 [Pisolithus sp. B1]|nr:HIRA-interacting protein 5 [Pisolithus sp. B1]